jgi:hypothetical protein
MIELARLDVQSRCVDLLILVYHSVRFFYPRPFSGARVRRTAVRPPQHLFAPGTSAAMAKWCWPGFA